MKKIIFTVIPVLLGIVACIYSVMLFFTGNLEFAGKYTPEGRDSGVMTLLAIIGIGLILYGLLNWLLYKQLKKETK